MAADQGQRCTGGRHFSGPVEGEGLWVNGGCPRRDRVTGRIRGSWR